jgi:hypothetical protein
VDRLEGVSGEVEASDRCLGSKLSSGGPLRTYADGSARSTASITENCQQAKAMENISAPGESTGAFARHRWDFERLEPAGPRTCAECHGGELLQHRAVGEPWLPRSKRQGSSVFRERWRTPACWLRTRILAHDEQLPGTDNQFPLQIAARSCCAYRAGEAAAPYLNDIELMIANWFSTFATWKSGHPA